MTACSASVPAASATDSSHMCSPVGAGCRKQRRGSVITTTRSPRKQSSLLLYHVAVLLSLLLSVRSQTEDEFTIDRTALNQQIQVAAFQSFPRRVKTGTVYDASLPEKLSSVVDVRMVRFRTGRLRRTGFQFQEVNLPVGMKVDKYMRHVVLVYRSFKDTNFHNISSGTEFVAAAIVGVHVYNGSNLTILDPLPELQVSATQRPIEVTVKLKEDDVRNVTCVLFDDTGFTTVSNFTSESPPKTCVYETLGDFTLLSALVVDISAGKGRNKNAWKIGVGAAAGAVVLVAFLCLAALVAVRYRERANFAKMERVADHGETLHHTLIGGGRAPAAAGTRTKPVLEGDYVN